MRPSAAPCCALWALAFVLVPAACGVETKGLRQVVGDGGVRDGRPDVPPVVSIDTTTLPRAGTKSMAVWTSAGGGSAAGPNGTVGVTIGCPAAAGIVGAANGARATVGHFADTTE